MRIYRLHLLERFIAPLLMRAGIHFGEKSLQKCKACKGKMAEAGEHLYLLPVKVDAKHEESAEYYIRNAKKIRSVDEIPAGTRACRMFIFECQNCGNKIVSVVDFLRVRDDEVLEGGDIYPYEKFKDFF